ncbi:hypothetical protein [Ramlibacter sp. AN1133]|uniref:hypothetical protein n=1 Tax=Ramlibacter sp. AN1133 TaxID=3133429 RepID=UPI0030C05A9F
MHWYEAAKFVPHQPQLRDALLFSPTLKEARNFARGRQDAWRADWLCTRHSVLVAGLGMLALQRPEMDLRRCPLAHVKTGLAGMQLPPGVLDRCAERFELWRRAPRVSVFGAGQAPCPVVGARLAKLVAPLPAWTLVTTCNGRAPWRVHDWARARYIPVQYLGTCLQRTGRKLVTAVIAASDHVVVFEQRKHRHLDFVLHTAKSLKRKISLELYEPDALAGAQLSIA